MRTSATQWSFFDERDIHPFCPAINGGRNRVAATEHNQIVVFGIHVKEMSRSVWSGQIKVCTAGQLGVKPCRLGCLPGTPNRSSEQEEIFNQEGPD